MTKTTKENPVHKDCIGQTIDLESYIVYPQHNRLCVGIVKKLNPKMIGVARLLVNKRGYAWAKKNVNKYPEDCVVVEGRRVTMLIMAQENETQS